MRTYRLLRSFIIFVTRALLSNLQYGKSKSGKTGDTHHQR